MHIAIGFVSMSGNTEDIVSLIQHELEQHDVDVTITELDQFVGEDLSRFDGLLLGSYTWETVIYRMKQKILSRSSGNNP